MDPVSKGQIRSDRSSDRVEFRIIPLNCTHLDAIENVARYSDHPEWSDKDFAYFLAHENGFCCGIEFIDNENSQLVAYLMALLSEGELDIATITTHRDWRRRGIASTLLEFSQRHFEVKQIALEVASENMPAIALYKKLQYQTTGTRKRYYSNGQDAYRMLKQL